MKDREPVTSDRSVQEASDVSTVCLGFCCIYFNILAYCDGYSMVILGIIYASLTMFLALQNYLMYKDITSSNSGCYLILMEFIAKIGIILGLIFFVVMAGYLEYRMHLDDWHVFNDEQRNLWRCRWAKIVLVGDKPRVNSLAWHSVVYLLGPAPPTKCLNHKFIYTELPERFTRCSVHSPQRVAMRTKSGKTNSKTIKK